MNNAFRRSGEFLRICKTTKVSTAAAMLLGRVPVRAKSVAAPQLITDVSCRLAGWHTAIYAGQSRIALGAAMRHVVFFARKPVTPHLNRS